MIRILFLVHILSAGVMAQSYDFDKAWQFAGPFDKPDSPTNLGASGVGPAEFIRVFQKNPQHLLTGSLSGGLFFSEDGGENWVNSGSDAWDYSGCGWADFYPENEKIWFAYSNVSDNNGKPGKMGSRGGIMRTINSGATWEIIASGNSLFANEGVSVYGFRFLPGKPEVMFVLSEAGLFYTEDCLASTVIWKKVTVFDGMIYDMDFMDEYAFVSVFQHGNWNIQQFDFSTMSSTSNPSIAELKEEKRSITFEPRGTTLLVLIDYSKGNDELWELNPVDGTLTKLLSSLAVNFGSGHTFAVNPHDENEFLIGHSVSLRKWNYTNLREQKMGSGYHVDVEFVSYDPTDTNKIYMACHGGVYMSFDKGLTWINKSNGLGIAEVMGLDVSETDPNQIVIGCFHDGSSLLADFNKDGNYFWRSVNGGDALTPLIDPKEAAIVYTSTQFSGGGIYYSDDTVKSFQNVHGLNGLSTPGWELTAVLHPMDEKLLYVNFTRNEAPFKGCIDIVRTPDATRKKSTEVISDFGKSHGLDNYRVYGLYNNHFFPDHLYAYVLHFDKNEEGKPITRHRLFKTEVARDSAKSVIDSWYELDLPVNAWLGDVEGDPVNPDQIYLSYAGGRDVRNNPEWTTGLIWSLQYHKKNKSPKRTIDLSRNIPTGVGGRFNLLFLPGPEKEFLVATRSGVYYGNKKTLKGKADWILVGTGLPHCKIYGLHYHEAARVITVGLFGRGVWRYYW